MNRYSRILAAVFGLAVGGAAFADTTVDNVGNGRGNDIDVGGNGKKDTTIVNNSGNGRRNDINIDPDRGDTVIVRGSGNGRGNTIHIDEAPGGTVIVDASAVGKKNKVIIDRAPGETVKIINSANGENNNVVIRDVDENGKPIRKNDRSGTDKGGPGTKHAQDAKPDDAAHHVTLRDRQALRAAPDGKLVKPAIPPKGGLPVRVSDPRVTTPKFPTDTAKSQVIDPRVTNPLPLKNLPVLAKNTADVKPGTVPPPAATPAKPPAETRLPTTIPKPSDTTRASFTPPPVARAAGRSPRR